MSVRSGSSVQLLISNILLCIVYFFCWWVAYYLSFHTHLYFAFVLVLISFFLLFLYTYMYLVLTLGWYQLSYFYCWPWKVAVDRGLRLCKIMANCTFDWGCWLKWCCCWLSQSSAAFVCMVTDWVWSTAQVTNWYNWLGWSTAQVSKLV